MKQWLLFFILFNLVMNAWAQDESQETESDATEQPIDTEATKEPPSEIPPTPKVYITPNKAKARNDDVIRYLKNFQREDEIIEILGQDGNISGLYLPENTGKPQGGVLILHDIGQHAHWPNTVTPIREYLPDYGWNTLSIFFDEYIHKPLPKVEPFQFKEVQEMGAENGELQDPTDQGEELTQESTQTSPNQVEAPVDQLENTNTSQDQNLTLGNGQEEADQLDQVADSLDEVPDFVPPITQEVLEQPAIPVEDAFIESMIQRTEDGLNSLNTMGQFNTAIIANGLSANWAAKMLQERLKTNNVGYALILIDAKASQYPKVNLNETLAELKIPLLDIITQDSPEFLRASKARKGAIMRKQNPNYTQLYLPAVTVSLYERDNMISRRIRGWLKTNAAGEEVPVKVTNN